MAQVNFFDLAEGQRLKSEGMEAAASYPWDQPIARARSIAIMLAKRTGTVCADDVWEYLKNRLPDVLEQIPPQGWGSVLKSPKLKFSGHIVESKKVSRHAGMQRVWNYNG